MRWVSCAVVWGCFLLAGCSVDQYKSPELLKTNDSFKHRKFTFEGDYKAAVERLKSRVPECLSRRIVNRADPSRGVSTATDYTPTLKIGETTTELHLQQKISGVIKPWSEPEAGLFAITAELKKLEGQQLAGEIHYPNGLGGYGGMGNYADAIEGWMRGTHMLCPN